MNTINMHLIMLTFIDFTCRRKQTHFEKQPLYLAMLYWIKST